MSKVRAYSQYCIEAASLLGAQIRLGRKQRKWTEQELADRINISRATLKKIEKGDVGCGIGLVFEAASLVGVRLFESGHTPLSRQLVQVEDKIALLPKSVQKSRQIVDDDF